MSREEINLSQIQLMDFYSTRLIELKKKHIINLLYKIKKKTLELSKGPKPESKLLFEKELYDIKLEIEAQVNHFINVEEFIKTEHPSLSEYLNMIDISIIELNIETA
jgi:hypothetical protein